MHLRSIPITIVTAFTALLTGCQLGGGQLSAPVENRIDATGPGLLVSEDGRASIEGLVSAAPGWVCVQADAIGLAGDVLGCAPVPAGESTNVPVTVETGRLTSTVHLVLYVDAGLPGELELPDPDVPARSLLGRSVDVTQALLSDPAWISVKDQLPAAGRTVTIDRVYTPVPALLVIHDVRDMHVLGFASLSPGQHFGLPITLEERGEVTAVIAELHWDTRNPGVLNITDPASKDYTGEFMKVQFSITGG